VPISRDRTNENRFVGTFRCVTSAAKQYASVPRLCRRKNTQYHAIFGQNGCAIVHPSTTATALVALGASVELVNAEGAKRRSLLGDFFLRPEQDIHRENDLKPGEVLLAILLPKLPVRSRSVHLQQGEKDSFDWPLAAVAVSLTCDASGVCERVSIILGAAAPVPYRAKAAESVLEGKTIGEPIVGKAGRAALTGATPLSKNAYKLPIFEALVRRAISATASS